MITLQFLNHFRQQRIAKNQLTVSPNRKGFDIRGYRFGRGVAIFAKAFMGIPAQQAAKTTRPLMPAAAPAALLLSLDTQQGVSNIILAMTRRDAGKPAFSLRKKRFVKTHVLSLLGTTRLLSRNSRADCAIKLFRAFRAFHGQRATSVKKCRRLG
jgi:hypothetical protein